MHKMLHKSYSLFLIVTFFSLSITCECAIFAAREEKETFWTIVTTTIMDECRCLLKEAKENPEVLNEHFHGLYDYCTKNFYVKSVDINSIKYEPEDIFKVSVDSYPSKFFALCPNEDYSKAYSRITLTIAAFLYIDPETYIIFKNLLNHPEKMYQFLWGNNSDSVDATEYVQQFSKWCRSIKINVGLTDFYASSSRTLLEKIFLGGVALALCAGIAATILR